MYLASPGFWGPVTSSVDWCEQNYEHSSYICEFFNTLSSLAMIAVGAVGILLHRRSLEARFLLAFFIVSVVGFGSVAFHATLRFELQMLDELPMLYSAIVMVYILLENRPTPRFGRWFPFALTGWAAIVTGLSALTRGKTQFYAFHLSFGSLESFALYRVYRIYRRTEAPGVRRMFRIGASLYAIAVAVWFADLRLCGMLSRLPRLGIPNPQLHAWWHVLVSCGLYALVLIVAYDRAQQLGLRPTLARKAGLVPFVHVEAAHARARTAT